MDSRTLFNFFISLLAVALNATFLYLQYSNLHLFDSNWKVDISFGVSLFIYVVLIVFVFYSLSKGRNGYTIPEREFLYSGAEGISKIKTVEELNASKKKCQSLYDDHIQQLQGIGNLAKSSISLGFLGTLIGLVLSLSMINETSQGDFETFNDAFKMALAGLFLAFYTSIGGIVTSFALGYNYYRLNKQLETQFASYEKTFIDTEKILLEKDKEEVRQLYGRFEEKFETKQDEIKTLKQDLEALAVPIESAVESLANRVTETFNEVFKESIDEFSKSVKEIPNITTTELGKITAEFNTRQKAIEELIMLWSIELNETTRNSLSDMVQVYNEYYEQITDNLNKYGDVSDKLQRYIDSLPERTEKLMKGLTDKKEEQLIHFQEAMNELVKDKIVHKNAVLIEKNITDYNNNINKTLKPLQDIISALDEHQISLQDLIQKMNTNGESFDTTSKSLNEGVSNLSKSLGNQNDQIIAYSENLRKIKEDLKEVANVREQLKKSAEFLESISISINKLSELVAKFEP